MYSTSELIKNKYVRTNIFMNAFKRHQSMIIFLKIISSARVKVVEVFF